MFGISTENIIDKSEGHERKPEYDSEDAFTLRYNQTDPTLISDGIDSVSVIAETRDTYLLDYHGYLAGYLRVTRRGMIELGETLLGKPDGIPTWIIRGSLSNQELPWWVPEEYDVELTISCQECGENIAPENILTPGQSETDSTDQFCKDCWEEVRDQWHAEHFDR